MGLTRRLFLLFLCTFVIGFPFAPVHSAAGMALLGHFGGEVSTGVVDGSHLYVGVGPRVEVYDVTDPAKPSLLGDIVLPGLVKDVAVSGQTVYAAIGGKGLWLIDVTNPSAPSILGSHSLSNGATHLIADGAIAYVASGSDIYKLDISSPTAIQMLGSYSGSTSITAMGGVVGNALAVGSTDGVRMIKTDTLTQVGFAAGGPVVAMAVNGNAIYAAIDGEGTVVIDGSDTSAPVKGNSFAITGTNGVVASGTHLFVADSTRVMIFSLATPLSPSFLANYSALLPSLLLGADGGKLYMVAQPSAVAIIDFSEPQNPSQFGKVDMPGFAHDAVTNGSYTFALTGGALYVLGGVGRIRPTVLGSLRDPEGATFTRLAVEGAYVYVLREFQGLSIVDISNPGQPTIAGSLNFSGPTSGLAVTNGHVLVADGPNGLRIIDVSQPSQPKEVSLFSPTGFVQSVAASGTYAYVADTTAGLRIVDVTNPSAPTETAVFQPSSPIMDVASIGAGRVLVSLMSGALVIVDVSDPAKPGLAAQLDTGATLASFAIHNGKAFVIQQTLSAGKLTNQLVTYDVTGGSITPKAVEQLDGFGRVYAAPFQVLLSLGQAGLYIYRNPYAPQLDRSVYLPQIARN